jgi:pyruvate/2-oxoacid:ferredoxin oxidoreductase beta subunit
MEINTYKKFYDHVLRSMEATEKGLWTLYESGQITAEQFATEIHKATLRYSERLQDFIKNEVAPGNKRQFKKQLQEFETSISKSNGQ